MRIMFVGGGTGGHFYPLIAVAEEILDRSAANGAPTPSLYYIGPDVYDKESLDTLGIAFVSCPAGKMRRYFSLYNVLDTFKALYGFFVALIKLYKIYPDVVMSKAGYTSVPVTLAAWLLRIPIVIHESDVKPGRANRIAKHFATYIAISYPEAEQYFPKEKVALTGIPIRKSILTGIVNADVRSLGMPLTRPLILVLGGSQGAERVNILILEALEELLPKYEIFHQTGTAHEALVADTAATLLEKNQNAQFYKSIGFVNADVVGAGLKAAALVVSRAGSTTIHESAIAGVPSILIPIPEEISHDQRSNAYAYARTGAAVVMEEENLTPHLLQSEIDRIIGNAETNAGMKAAAKAFAKTDAAAIIAETLIGIGNSHGG